MNSVRYSSGRIVGFHTENCAGRDDEKVRREQWGVIGGREQVRHTRSVKRTHAHRKRCHLGEANDRPDDAEVPRVVVVAL